MHQEAPAWPQVLRGALLITLGLLTGGTSGEGAAAAGGQRSARLLVRGGGSPVAAGPFAQEEEFIVDDSHLKAKSPGLAYRASPRPEDWNGGIYAAWGTKVKGERYGDEWLKTKNGYLPMRVKDEEVLAPAGNGGIVAAVLRRTWWGHPSYMKYLDAGLPSWEELARVHGHMGNLCSSHNALQQCGAALVCRAGACGECVHSRDCANKHSCQTSLRTGHRSCIFRDLQEQWTWREGLCTVLVVVTALLSAAAGMGGGGVYVPLLLLLLDFSTKEAVPLSQAMIMGGATMNIIMFCGERHPRYPGRPKIDYDVVMMLNPGLAAGVTFGVMLNVISPQWIIVVVLVMTLVLALHKSLTKGIEQFRKESKMLAERPLDSAEGSLGDNCSLSSSTGGIKIKIIDLKSFGSLVGENQRPLGLIVVCWAAFLVSNLLKARACSRLFWLQLLGMLVLCLAFTAAGAKTILHQAQGPGGPTEGVLAWTPKTLWLYPLLSTVAGFLGGFLGIGGGIIMGPLLLELGMAAEASQATTALFVFLSSSLATIQFVVMGKAMPQYAFWFTTWVLMSTFVGQTIVSYVLRRWKRSSFIVLAVAAIVAGSLAMMTTIGAMDIVTDVRRGADMDFGLRHLCG